MAGANGFSASDIKQYDPMQSLASVVGMAGGIQNLRSQQLQQQSQQQQNTDQAISLRERQAVSSIDPSTYVDANGDIDLNKAVPQIMKAAPTTGMKYIQGLSDAQAAHTASQRAISSQTDENRQRIGQVLYGITPDAATDPDIVHKTLDALGTQYRGMDAPIGMIKQAYDAKIQSGDKQGAYALLQQASKNVLPQQTQQAMNTGQVSAIPSAGGTQLVQTAAGAQQPQGAPIGQPITPPNQIVTTPTGGMGIANPATGQIAAPNGGQQPPMVSLPPGESMDTYKQLQDQRTAAQQQAVQAPVLHDINREVKATLAKGVTTGQLGGVIARTKSVLGIGSDTAEQGASDYDILGKMLERSALTASQGMGPQTNAGLEAQIKANGSTAYNPTSLRTIANLNDALVTGSEKYQAGLEKAIASSPNSVFAKRQFDQQWAANADPMALRLVNAAKNHDTAEINDIFRSVGGPRSQGGNALRQKLMNLKALSEQGSIQ